MYFETTFVYFFVKNNKQHEKGEKMYLMIKGSIYRKFYRILIDKLHSVMTNII